MHCIDSHLLFTLLLLSNVLARAYLLQATLLVRPNSCKLSAAFAMQTLRQLHWASELCHLDLSPANVMMREDKCNAWDSVRLIDLAFAQTFDQGKFSGCMVLPVTKASACTIFKEHSDSKHLSGSMNLAYTASFGYASY